MARYDAEWAAIEAADKFADKAAEDADTPTTQNVARTREALLAKARDTICGHREQEYGSPEDNFGLIGQLWTVYTGHLITAEDVALMMCLFKIARLRTGTGTEDSYVDLAGYAACGGEIHMKKEASE